MTAGNKYRVRAGDLTTLALAENDPLQKVEYERLAQAYLLLAEQADRNALTDITYETPPPPNQIIHQHQQQQQQQQQSKPDKESQE
jgi:hypothetical protein